jgi:hypothetical protein
MKVLGLRTSGASNHRTLVVGTGPTQIFHCHHLGSVVHFVYYPGRVVLFLNSIPEGLPSDCDCK